ncbi:hypothetical protein L345_04592, partial [Ophiophagus hannah]
MVQPVLVSALILNGQDNLPVHVGQEQPPFLPTESEKRRLQEKNEPRLSLSSAHPILKDPPRPYRTNFLSLTNEPNLKLDREGDNMIKLWVNKYICQLD